LLVRSADEVLVKYHKVAEEFGFTFTKQSFDLEAINCKVVVHHRDPAKLARWMFLNPATYGKIECQFSPRYVQREDGTHMRVTQNFSSGKWMEEKSSKLPAGSNIFPIMESYDKTHLDLQGNQKAFGQYWVANGLHADEKQKMSNWWTFALRPIIMTNKRTKEQQKKSRNYSMK
jgi:hypothetical protein